MDTGKTLQIEAGTKIYLHADAPFLVDGTLIVRGTKNEPVIFEALDWKQQEDFEQ